jgi:purine nucleosidase
MVDLDLCRKVLAKPEDIEPVRSGGGTNAEMVADMLAGYIRIGTNRVRTAMAIYDPSAAVAFVAPDIVRFRPARIDVELHGQLTRGRTVVETRASHAIFNAQFADDIDADKAHTIILAALVNEARK